MQTAVTPDCLVSALISFPVLAAPNFQHLESRGSLPCLPGTHRTRQRLVSLGRMGRQENIGNNHEYTYAVVFLQLSVAFTSAVPRDAFAFMSALAPEPCPSTAHRDVWASATHELSPLSSHVLFRITFYTTRSAVIVFWWSVQISALPRFSGWDCAGSLAGGTGWPGQGSWWDVI